jgi:exopolyphosphatase/pppGpp-phosphohydrolase
MGIRPPSSGWNNWGSDSEFIRNCVQEAIQRQASLPFGCGELQERFRGMRVEKQEAKDAKREAARVAKRDSMRAKRAAARAA